MPSTTDRQYTRYAAPDNSPIVVRRWPSEQPLLAIALIVSAFAWLGIIVSIIGFVYAVLFAVFFALMHLAFIAYVRGSAVRLGPNQFPELHQTVERLAVRMGLERVPEAYLMQAGGSLNAFATRFLRSHIIVLFSDLLEACGDNTAARDMIIAHELGHIKAGHLRAHWFLLPACFVPFLMPALSRAREYTCDRYGLAGAGDVNGAGLGLAILAAGAEHGPRVNRAELVKQRTALETSGLMTLGSWMASHPPLSKRLAAIDPSLGSATLVSRKGAVRAGLALAAVPVAGIVMIAAFLSSSIVQQFRAITDSARVAQSGQRTRAAAGGAGGIAGLEEEDSVYTPPPDAAERARADLLKVAQFLEADHARRPLPWNSRELYQRLAQSYPGRAPMDPYDGSAFGYDYVGGEFVLFSSGPDQESWTDDDIRYDSRVHRLVAGAPARR